MRVLTAALILAAATPATAQLPPSTLDNLRLQELQMQQDMARQRLLTQELELNALDNRIRTQQSLNDIEAQRGLPPPTLRPYEAGRPAATVPTGGFASVPDDRLAASNATVKSVTDPRR